MDKTTIKHLALVFCGGAFVFCASTAFAFRTVVPVLIGNGADLSAAVYFCCAGIVLITLCALQVSHQAVSWLRVILEDRAFAAEQDEENA